MSCIIFLKMYYTSFSALQKFSKKILSNRHAVCMTMKNDGSLFAIGCNSSTLLYDSRMLSVVKKIQARYDGCGLYIFIIIKNNLYVYNNNILKHVLIFLCRRNSI